MSETLSHNDSVVFGETFQSCVGISVRNICTFLEENTTRDPFAMLHIVKQVFRQMLELKYYILRHGFTSDELDYIESHCYNEINKIYNLKF